ncbi:MAG: putative quinol monooxygenase [Propioniciclava sp.]
MAATPVILYATFTATPGHADTVADLLRDFAETVRAEPGNVIFDATQTTEDPHSFFVYEEYRDQAAFQAHIDAPSQRPFNEALSPLIVEPRSQLTFLHRI